MQQNPSLFARLVDSAIRHRFVVFPIFVVIVGLAVVYVLAAPKQYASTMQMVVREARERPLVSADKATPETAPETSQELMESHAEEEYAMLSADDIMQRAVQYRARVVPDAPNPAPGTPEMAKQIKRISARFKIVPMRKTPVIEVTYSDVTPEAAQAVLQELQRADLEKHIRVMRPGGTVRVFTEEKAAFDKSLAEAEKQLSSFQIQNNLSSLIDEESSLEKDRDATRTALLQEQASLASEKSQMQSLQDMLAHTPERVPTTVRESPNFYTIQQVTSVLVDLTNQRTKLLTRYQPTDRLVVEADKQIADTEARLQNLKTDPTTEKDSDNNPVWIQAEQQLALAGVAVASSMAKTNALSSQLTELDGRLHQLQNITAENDMLESKVDQLKDTQRQYADKLTNEMVEDVLDRAKLGNIAIAMEPTISSHPVSPNVPLVLALGLLGATTLSGIYLFAMESHRTTFFTPYELQSALGLRVLGTIPETRSPALAMPTHYAGEFNYLIQQGSISERRQNNGNSIRRS